MKSTIVTFGKVALENERANLARSFSVGGQVLAVEHLIERLAGGFLKIVDTLTLREAVVATLDKVDLGELDSIKGLPGMANACAQSLMAWWTSGLRFDEYQGDLRLAGLRNLEKAVLQALPYHQRRPSDIVELACSKAHLARKIFGNITFRGMTDLHPVWRTVFSEIVKTGDVVWDCGPYPVPSWIEQFGDRVEIRRTPKCNPKLSAETAADARHEVIEGLRWAQSLLASGVVAGDIAIAAVDTGAYSDIITTIAQEADMKLHISSGVPLLQTDIGQECAALADILVRGVSQKRIRRLFELSGNEALWEVLRKDWLDSVSHDAALMTLHRWQTLLDRRDMRDVREIVSPILELLFAGASKAEESGKILLSKDAFVLWGKALRQGPASAVDQTLKDMALPTRTSSLDKVSFMSARELVSAPRKYVRLIGLTARAWPRGDGEDRLIPNYVVPKSMLSPMSISEMDRRDFYSILLTTAEEVVFSWARLDSDGRELRPSTLVPVAIAKAVKHNDRTRSSRHAISENDRRFMRTAEFVLLPDAQKARQAYQNWHRPVLTSHDGLVSKNHPRMAEVFKQTQSATSLQRLIRDPIGFMWKYGLGFYSPEYEDDPILVDARLFGNIVHGILSNAVEKLSKRGGFRKCPFAVVQNEVFKARLEVALRMEQTQPVPPNLVWVQTLDRAEAFACKALTHDYGDIGEFVSYVEIPFGGDREWLPENLPWAEDRPVLITGTDIRIRGILDRLDLSASSSLARVVDYKTGKVPAKRSEMGIQGGKELQRAFYGFAVKALLDGCEQVVSGLYYPIDDAFIEMNDLDVQAEVVAAAVKEAQSVVMEGYTLPGIDAANEYNDMLFAFPTRATSFYLPRKTEFIGTEFSGLRQVWETP